ncbi:hypothetical protein PMY56_13535 [Clostridium tertium]|uniref:hypothetical protein n=1 Tax=Clostridium tertium TaxID=1559 RepID=UPI00232F5B2F|nr:hypothetical protein [Clostridium tertium]MDB1924080.1 hypothetical protein [Clostridium tertium]MDB1927159.1 hypothetical protein [Clostridium tertium]MDB1930936.1 hypothetical protein [Clostridium tertium]
MNRQERRKRDREIDKDKDFVKKLSANETKRMNEIIDKITKDKAEQAIDLIYGSFISVLVNEGCSFEEIRKVEILMTEFMLDEKEKTKILEKENVDMTKLQIEVREFMKGLIAQGKNRKEVIEETVFKFPKATKNMINRTFGEIDDEKVLDDAAAYILEDNKNIKKAIEKEDAKKIAAEVARQIEKEIEKEDHNSQVEKKVQEEVKEEKSMCKLKIKKLELEGEYGSYIREGNKVTAGEITFNSLQELEEYKKREIELFNLKMQEIEAVYKAEVR